MAGRIGVVALLLGLFAGGLAAGTIHADATPPPVTTTGVTTVPSTETTTTAPVPTETAPPTVTTAPSTPAPAPPRNVLAAARAGNGECLLIAAFAFVGPDGSVRLLGPAVEGRRTARSATRDAGYPAGGAITSAASLTAATDGCRGGRTASGTAQVRSLSLFGGAVKAATVELDVRGGRLRGRVGGLTIADKAAAATGARTPIGDWGYAIAMGDGGKAAEGAALTVHLTKAHAGLSAGTLLLVSFARVAPPPKPTPPAAKPARRATKPVVPKRPAARTSPAPKPHERTRAHTRKRNGHHGRGRGRGRGPGRHDVRKKHRRHARKRHLGDPLKVTPPLGGSDYVFPVAGAGDYIDTYGGFRGDVPGNWHHGDDIFASLGTPVVAVADATLNRVGWERLGGWRLWVRDHHANEFYYAHLSGYSPLALHSKYVQAGDVIGFIGNTGDAFTTPPHLHFEIHPHQLLTLDYNGAVDPTSYLDAWRHVTATRVPIPARPAFPAGPVRAETRYVWRQLLAARGLIVHKPSARERPRISTPGPDSAAGARLTERRLAANMRPTGANADGSAAQALGFAVEILLAPLVAGIALLLRRRKREA